MVTHGAAPLAVICHRLSDFEELVGSQACSTALKRLAITSALVDTDTPRECPKSNTRPVIVNHKKPLHNGESIGNRVSIARPIMATSSPMMMGTRMPWGRSHTASVNAIVNEPKLRRTKASDSSTIITPLSSPSSLNSMECQGASYTERCNECCQ